MNDREVNFLGKQMGARLWRIERRLRQYRKREQAARKLVERALLRDLEQLAEKFAEYEEAKGL